MLAVYGECRVGTLVQLVGYLWLVHSPSEEDWSLLLFPLILGVVLVPLNNIIKAIEERSSPCSPMYVLKFQGHTRIKQRYWLLERDDECCCR